MRYGAVMAAGAATVTVTDFVSSSIVPARTVATLDLLSQGRVEFAAADPERAGLRGGPQV